ncbi:MAG: ribonuclease III [Deltaproteobacteria bacterium]|nr:ribonuclease III [Deltaproteobacteria bacterium]
METQDETIESVAQTLGHRFENPSLLIESLTHSSYANERPELASTDNDRLEFMGDAVLQWVVSSLLWERFPGAAAGELTRRRADLVCEATLAEIAQTVGIGGGLRLGRGEERSGGRKKPRLLSSALEACIAAVYLDGGTEAAITVCRKLFIPRIENQNPGARDYKSRVQETLQSRKQNPPHYVLIGSDGPDHDRYFRVVVTTDSGLKAEGEGHSKAEAEQLAARDLLAKLEEETGETNDR